MYNANGGGNGIYPTAPLESEITDDQRPMLAAPFPPSYDQVMANKTPTATTLSSAYPPYQANIPPHVNVPVHNTLYIPPPTPSPSHIVFVTQPSVQTTTTTVAPLMYGPRPLDMQCPFCHNYIRTRLRHKATSRTHLIAFLMCFLQLYCCACLPYCIPSCMNTNHYCGLCNNYLGTYVRG